MVSEGDTPDQDAASGAAGLPEPGDPAPRAGDAQPRPVKAKDVIRGARSPVQGSEDLENADKLLRLELKEKYANWAGVAVLIQVLLANALFIIYALVQGFEIEPPIMIAWLSATVIQTIGVVHVITRNLFPPDRRG
ncbi:hypothetical protein DQ241_06325 [Blastococcus sp. TF02A-30]|nr:hypothetical protein DQ241_06325 [Blastococcus sp. TF02A-30]